jgi:hypothetical protein
MKKIIELPASGFACCHTNSRIYKCIVSFLVSLLWIFFFSDFSGLDALEWFSLWFILRVHYYINKSLCSGCVFDLVVLLFMIFWLNILPRNYLCFYCWFGVFKTVFTSSTKLCNDMCLIDWFYAFLVVWYFNIE